jgi:glucosamine--fructose-6-phosphate aminotransferase (isomerizing)
MCGIMGATAQRNITPILLEGLERLEYRGYDSAGLTVLVDGQLKCLRRTGKVAQLKQLLKQNPVAGNLGIAHTRWATHGVPTVTNAHPHQSHQRIALVHNGIIDNYEAIRTELTSKGYVFASQTDTEVIVHLIHSYCARGLDLVAAVIQATKRFTGAYAIGVIDLQQPNRLVAARMGSPLVVGIGSGESYIASDQLALLQVTDQFMFLQDGDVANLSLDDVTVLDRAAQIVQRTVSRFEYSNESADKGYYKHYMLKEIDEQPVVIANGLGQYLTDWDTLETLFSKNAHNRLMVAKRVQIVACGTSYHAGLVARYWIESLSGLPCQVECASEFRYRQPVLLSDTLLILLSQSGETADVLAALRHIDTDYLVASLAICNVPSSSLVRESDLSLLTRAGPEIGVASTKAFTTQLVALLILTLVLARTRQSLPKPECRMLVQLAKLPDLLQQVLQLKDVIETLAGHFANKHHALFLGRGSLYPIALEGALKLKEISYIHAEAYPAGELKHGPLALVDRHMPVVAVVPDNSLLEKLKANLHEVRARGGELFLFVDQLVNIPTDEAVHIVRLPRVDPLLAPILYTLPLQLLAYHVAVIKGTDVDQPRNLAKSVTVE